MSRHRPSPVRCLSLALVLVVAGLVSKNLAAVDFASPIESALAGPGVGGAMAWGDLDRNCSLDLVFTRDITVASETPGLIVRLGNGLGGFSTGTALSAGRHLSDAELADFNGDGFLDLVVTENFDPPASVAGPCISATPVVPVLLGDGAGSFTASACLAAKDHPSGVAAGDFDEDGVVDLLVINAVTSSSGATSAQAMLFRGTGDGSFLPGVRVFDRRGHEIEAADVDGDRHLDVLVAGESGTFVFLGAGDGSFVAGPNVIGVKSREIALGDVNGDGALDVAIVGSDQLTTPDDVVWVSLNLADGSGGFAAPTSYLTGPHPVDVGLGDLDRDGFADVVVANNLGDDISVFPANPDGTLQAQQLFPAGMSPMALVVADFDRDGFGDVAVSDRNRQPDGTLGDGTVSVLLQIAGGLLDVGTSVLPDGQVARPYEQCLDALHGTAPYDWSLILGGLPSGLLFDSPAGRLHGTPSVEQTASFTVRVDDAAHAAAEQPLTLRICADADLDRYNTCQGDCDDADPDRFPGNPEVCDAKDNDCDGLVDSGLDGDGDGTDDLCDNCPAVFNDTQLDSDNDGTGDACDACPTDPGKISPGVCGCGVADVDGDSDGTPDCIDACPADPAKISPGVCGCGVADTDADEDGLAACLDCDDFNPFCTSDCTDLDGDGFCVAADCDDSNPFVRPGAPEIGCDGSDNDCSAATPDLRDGDGDTYLCDIDCNDANGAIHPGAPEIGCDGLDNDCSAATTDVRDGDGDSFSCDVDCNDLDPLIWARPGEARALAFDSSKTGMAWLRPRFPGSSPQVALQYDVIRSPNPGDFFSSAVCVEADDGSDAVAVDSAIPSPGQLQAYLVRAQNGCGEGDSGWTSSNAPRIAVSCPAGP